MREKTDTWMPLYIGDYLADTVHLSTLEHGAYLLLLMTYWRNKGPLPDDDVKLARMTRLSLKQWKAIRPNVIEFFRAGDGQIVSTRSERELDISRNRSEKARSSALIRHGKADALATDPQCGTDAQGLLAGACPSASPSPSQDPSDLESNTPGRSKRTKPAADEFDRWYAEYPLKKDPAAARKAYERARNKTSAECLLAGAVAYAGEVRDAGTEKNFMKHPSTWLNKECWENYEESQTRSLPLLGLAVDNTRPRAEEFDDEAFRWRNRCQMHFVRGMAWDTGWGPAPGQRWCEVPAKILAEFADRQTVAL